MEEQQFVASDLDALREVANIGAGHAATALGRLLGTVVMTDVPTVSLLPIDRVAQAVGGEEAPVTCVHLTLSGDASGSLLLFLPPDCALDLAHRLLHKPPEEVDLNDALDQSALREVANILASAYLTAIGRLLDLLLIPSIPGLAFDMAGAVTEEVLGEVALVSNQVVLIQTELYDLPRTLRGQLAAMMNPQALRAFLDRFPRPGQVVG